MKVHHFNSYPYGGAANAALRIHHGLCNQQVDSTFYYRINDRSEPQDPSVQLVNLESQSSSGSPSFFSRQIEKRRRREIHRLYDSHIAKRDSTEHEVFSMARLPDKTSLNWKQHASDVVHLHWLAHMADYPSFFASIPDQVPVVWTLHDMSPFTGGCHYAGNCTQFKSGCGNCSQVAGSSPRDVSFDSFRWKKKSLRRKNIHVVAPSSWLIGLAKQSPVWPDSTKFSVIHYGLDLERFRLQSQSAARNTLGLPQEATIVGFGAEDLTNKRKGFQYLCEALRSLGKNHTGKHPEIQCAVFGGGEIPEDIKSQFHVHEFGFVQDPDTIANIFSASDFVVVPSLEDNQPQVGLEAMASGRPVIGFDAGGIPEYVADGETGLLVPARDSAGLAKAILAMAQDNEARHAMAERAQKLVESQFEMVEQTEAYIRLYKSFFKGRFESVQAA